MTRHKALCCVAVFMGTYLVFCEFLICCDLQKMLLMIERKIYTDCVCMQVKSVQVAATSKTLGYSA